MNRLDWEISIKQIVYSLFGIFSLLGLLIISTWADQEVTFKDENLEAVIREAVNKPIKSVFQSDVIKITDLDASGRDIEHLDGIEHLTNLVVLDLSDNPIKNLTPLGTLHHLRVLNLEANQINDLGPIHALVNLQELNLKANQVTDISPLQNLKLLVELNLRDNNIADLDPISTLHELEYLNIHSNKNISSTHALENLTKLETLIMANVPFGENIQVLSSMERLTYLNITNGQISNISPLRNLTRLTTLKLRGNNITDLSPLSKLTNLVYLDIHSNVNIQSVTPLKNLFNLQTLIMENVFIGPEINFLSEMKELRHLNIRNCGVSSVDILGELMRAGTLQDNPGKKGRVYVDISDNPISLETTDLLEPIRPYWNKIDNRIPFKLPTFYTLASPVFSHNGGYYAYPFELTLEAEEKDTHIYYTLDGSEPTKNDFLYNAPITIKSRKGESPTLAGIQEVSPRWTPPNGEVFMVTVIRARVFDEDGNGSPTVTHTYIVDEEKRYTLPVISIATNPAYLFDYNDGIYIMGRVYDELFNPNPDLNPWERAANYTQYGEEWERPIHIEFFETSGELGFSLNAGVRIHGTSTRERAQKSLRIYAQAADGENEYIDYTLFPNLVNPITGIPVERFKTIVLRNGGNDWEYTLFRDALMQSLVSHTLVNTQAYRPVIVFLNGEYWGIYNVRERVDEYYLETYFSVNSNDIVLLSNNGKLHLGSPGDELHYLDMLNFIQTHDMANEENYSYVQTLMDVDNYIDYQIAEIYFDNINWPHANIKYWRKNVAQFEPKTPYGHDGRWRWILYDTDFSFGLKRGKSSIEHNNLLNAIRPKLSGNFLSYLLNNPEFRISFINRFADQLNTAFIPHRVNDQITQMQSALEPEIEEAIRRWRGRNGSVNRWENSVDFLRYFAEARPDYVRQHIIDYFDLGGTAKVSLSTDEGMGYIVINSISITIDTPGVDDSTSWTGIYFQDVPIEITAIPQQGYRFLRWEGAPGINSVTETISITLEDDISLRAVFEVDD